MHLERLGATHLEAVAEVERLGQTHPWTRDTLARALDDAMLEVWGAWRAQTLLGFAVLARLPFEVELQALTVRPEARRQGVGHDLLRHLVTRAEALAAERLLLEVREGNAPALALYRQLGFREDGRRPGYYPPTDASAGKRETAVLMSYPLAEGAST